MSSRCSSCSWCFAGWVNRKQLEVIDYLKEENRVLREQLDSFSRRRRRRGNDNAPIARRERLGGLLNYYYRSAA
jgi:hypothetical protein